MAGAAFQSELAKIQAFLDAQLLSNNGSGVATAQGFAGFSLNLERAEMSLSAQVCFAGKDSLQNLEAQKILTPAELTDFNEFSFEKRKSEFLLGRLVSKLTVSEWLQQKGKNWDLLQLRMGNDIFNKPYCHPEQPVLLESWPNLSLSHSHGMAAALVFSREHPMGIDLEKIDEKHTEVVAAEMTSQERDIFAGLGLKGALPYTLNWTIKEAYSKAIGVGLTTPFKVMEVKEIQGHKQVYFETWLRNFHQFRVHSWVLNGYVCSIAVPYKTKLSWTALSAKASIFTKLEALKTAPLVKAS